MTRRQHLIALAAASIDRRDEQRQHAAVSAAHGRTATSTIHDLAADLFDLAAKWSLRAAASEPLPPAPPTPPADRPLTWSKGGTA